MSLLNIRKDSAEKPAKAVSTPRGTSMRPSSDRLAHVEAQLKVLTGRVDGHDDTFKDHALWQQEAQQRVNKLETITGGTSQRQCPGCLEMRHDGPESFPGYLMPVARQDEPEYHAYRQLCALCQADKDEPGYHAYRQLRELWESDKDEPEHG